MITIGATGSIIRGDILDVNKDALEASLRAYDPQLYLTWNAAKRRGYGCWELRRRPDKKTAIYQCTLQGVNYFHVKPVELDIINHVMDVPYLNYSIITKLKAMDTWSTMPNLGEVQRKYWIDKLETAERDYRDALQKKNREELSYNLKQNKRAIMELRDKILSGVNPALLAQYWGQSGR